MSDPAKSADIEDVLTSIRRLLAQDAARRAGAPAVREEPAPAGGRLVLTPDFRVAGGASAAAGESAEEPVQIRGDSPVLDDLPAPQAPSLEDTLAALEAAIGARHAPAAAPGSDAVPPEDAGETRLSVEAGHDEGDADLPVAVEMPDTTHSFVEAELREPADVAPAIAPAAGSPEPGVSAVEEAPFVAVELPETAADLRRLRLVPNVTRRLHPVIPSRDEADAETATTPDPDTASPDASLSGSVPDAVADTPSLAVSMVLREIGEEPRLVDASAPPPDAPRAMEAEGRAPSDPADALPSATSIAREAAPAEAVPPTLSDGGAGAEPDDAVASAPPDYADEAIVPAQDLADREGCDASPALGGGEDAILPTCPAAVPAHGPDDLPLPQAEPASLPEAEDAGDVAQMSDIWSFPTEDRGEPEAISGTADAAPEAEDESLAANPSAASAAPEDGAPVAEAVDLDRLRDLVAGILRQELQGPLGERMTRNVRKLVRAEIRRTLAGRDLE